ncbi:MAG: hypothetical protein JXB49_19770 [Bacteroidales bacterium]|nr:hypothetical protein [Bacteroidales bacterium]
MDNEQIKGILEGWLNKKEEAGEKGSGSGHLSFVSFIVNDILSKEQVSEGWNIEFSYTQYIETEFTYYPDNPPYEYPGQAKVVISEEGEVKEIKEEP